MSLSTIMAQLVAISLREPLCLLLALVPIVLAAIHKLMRRNITQYADAHLLPWVSVQQSVNLRQRLLSKNSAFILAWILFGIAAAGPRTALEYVEPEKADKLDIMLVIDVSRSMQVNDIKPSRIRRAQIELDELITRAPGNRIGIIIFAARPHLLAPLTSDMSALRFYLRTLDEIPLPTAGSNPYTALALAEQELAHSRNPGAIVLLSDGDFSATENSTQAQDLKTPLYILGLGTTQGAAIPLNNGQWLEQEGQAIISRLNTTSLQTLISKHVSQNKQRFATVSDDGKHWQQLYDHGMARLQPTPSDSDASNKIIWQEHFHWPLSMAIILLWLSLTPYILRKPGLTNLSKSKLRHRSTQKNSAASGTQATAINLCLISAGIILLVFSASKQVNAAPLNSLTTEETVSEHVAYQAFINKRYLDAINTYKQLSGFNARFGEAASHYRLEDYTQAIRQFSQAVLLADNDQDRAQAIFNLGNSYFHNGMYAKAITTYQDVLHYTPNDQRTQHNLDFSIALKKAVDERARKLQRQQHRRMGSGARTGAIADGINTNPEGVIMIDDSESEEAFALPELAKIDKRTLEQLINNGLAHIQLADEKDNTTTRTGLQLKPLAFIQARIRMSELEDQHTLLWKRLFEMEEGFPAPLDEPREIPGEPTW